MSNNRLCYVRKLCTLSYVLFYIFILTNSTPFFSWMGLHILVTADGQILINRKHSSSCCSVPSEHFQKSFSNWQPPMPQLSFLLFWQMGCNTHLPRVIIVNLSELRPRRTLAVNTSDGKWHAKAAARGFFPPLLPRILRVQPSALEKLKMVQSEEWVYHVCIGTSISVLFFVFVFILAHPFGKCHSPPWLQTFICCLCLDETETAKRQFISRCTK